MGCSGFMGVYVLCSKAVMTVLSECGLTDLFLVEFDHIRRQLRDARQLVLRQLHRGHRTRLARDRPFPLVILQFLFGGREDDDVELCFHVDHGGLLTLVVHSGDIAHLGYR